MEDILLLLLAGTAVYLAVQMIIEAYTLVDHAIMARKARRR